MAKENGFLPINKKEMRERGWKQADFVYVCGDEIGRASCKGRV